MPLTCQFAPMRYLSPSFQRGYWERRHWVRTFGSDEMSDSDECSDLFELYIGDGTFARRTGLSEEEYSQLFDEVLPLCTGHRPLCAVTDGPHALGHNPGVAQDKRALPNSGWPFGAA